MLIVKEDSPVLSPSTRFTFSPWAAAVLYLCGFAALFGSFLFANKRPIQRMWIGFLGWDRVPASAAAGAILFLLGLLLLTLGYILLWRSARAPGPASSGSGRVHRLHLLSIGLIGLFVILPPSFSSDVFSYYQVGWVRDAQHANPYLTAAGYFAGYPAVAEAKGANVMCRTPYGPLWTHTEALIWRMSGGHLVGGILLFKLLAALGCLASASLLGRIVRAGDPGRAAEAWIYFAANPLVLIEGPGMGHYDPVPILVVLLGVWLQLKLPKRLWIGAALFLLALLFKATALPALGMIIYWLVKAPPERKAGILAVGKALLAGAILLAVSGLPFVQRASHVPLLLGSAITSMTYEIRFTPFNLVKHGLAAAAQAMGVPRSLTVANWITTALLVLSLGLFFLARVRGRKSFLDHMEQLAPFYAVITIALGYWRPWFLLWPLALAPLAPRRWMKLIAVYSVLAMATYVITSSSGIGLIGPTW